MNLKFFFIPLVVAMGLGVFLFFQSGDREISPSKALLGAGNMEADVTVAMTPDGFMPQEVTIRKGQTVKWLNKDSDWRWPASDLHPLHDLYPEFDPKEPLAPGESWSFTFQKEGSWRYHDHLGPGDRGIVVVLPN